MKKTKKEKIISSCLFLVLLLAGVSCGRQDPEIAPVLEALHFLRGDDPSIPQDVEKGSEKLRELADNGNAVASHELGMCYKDGIGVMRNHAATVKYLSMGADKNYPPALYDLAILYLEGKIVGKDEEKGFQLLKKASDSKYKQAYIYVMYLADQGNPRAQYIYAGWLENGVQEICDRDPEKALQYYQESAGQGYKAASGAYLKMLQQKLESEIDRFAIDLFATTNSAMLPLSEEVNLEMVKIQGGFLQGKGRKIILTHNFAIGKHEVTQQEFEAVMGYNPSWFKGENRPVEQVDWREAMKFCQKLTEKFSEQLPEGYCFSLPTSAQWEYAARGGNKSGGTTYSGSDNPDDIAWYDVNSDKQTHPVEQKKPNELGLYDMSGNVWEWCRDGFARGGVTANINPEAPDSVENRIYRGGSWCNAKKFSECSNFNYFAKKNRFSYLGFRVAMIPSCKEFSNQTIPLEQESAE